MFFIGTGTALVAVFIDYFVTTFYKLKFEWTKDGMEPCFPSSSPPPFQSICLSLFLSFFLSHALLQPTPLSRERSWGIHPPLFGICGLQPVYGFNSHISCRKN